jgi:hypothetical protein
MASQRKRKQNIIDELFGTSPFDEASEGSYSISVVQTPEGTKVRARVGKGTDANALKKQLQQQYPNAQIEIEGGKKEPLIKEISATTIKKENNEKNRE